MWFLSELNHLDGETKARMKAGGFVVRRIATEYGGISPDLAIEQSMMGAIKGKTGLIREHEFTELNYLTWLPNRPVISKVNNAMKEMTGYSSKIDQTSVKVLRKSRIRRDCDDEQTIHDFFTKRLVLSPEAPTQLKSIATGIISPKSVSVHLAYEIGTKLVTNLAGSNPLTVTIKKADLCIQMPLRAAVSSSASASIGPPLIDPNLMFQRAHAQASNSENPISMEECLTYKLSPYPMSLFTDTGHMRLPQDKSELATHLIEKYAGLIQADANMNTTVMDGGAVMHHVVWGKRERKKDEPKPLVRDIMKLYVDKAKRESSTSSTIIEFDGYQRWSPKDHCRKIRSPIRGLEFDLHGNADHKSTICLPVKPRQQVVVDWFRYRST